MSSSFFNFGFPVPTEVKGWGKSNAPCVPPMPKPCVPRHLRRREGEETDYSSESPELAEPVAERPILRPCPPTYRFRTSNTGRPELR